MDPIGAMQMIAGAVAGWLAGRGRVRRELDRLERDCDRERAERKQLEVQLASAMRELAFTNALVVELVRNSTHPPQTAEQP